MSVRLLGLDPGTRLAGYGVIDYDPRAPLRPELVDAGVIRLDTKAPLVDRLVELERELVEILTEHRPAAVGLEEVYAHYNHPKTAIIMAHARGVMLLACRRTGVAVYELSANRVKQSLTGHGHADKVQMQRAVQAQWNLPTLPEPPDVADALAVALCLGRSGDVDHLAGL
jgi:crossover junction endodeoxyribonuclease RuvC